MDILSYVAECAVLVFLGILAWEDLRTKTVPGAICIAGLGSGVLLNVFSGRIPLWEIAAGCAVGGMLLLIAKLSKGGVGYGDGLTLSACGVWLGFYENVFLLICALILLALFGTVLIMLKKAKRKDSLPFIPFLLAGYVFMQVFE